MLFGDSSEIQIFGYPIPNDLSSIITSKPTPWSVIDQTTTFDISSLSINHEVLTALLTYTIQSPSDITISWYRERDNFLIFTLSDSISSGFWSQYASWVGYCTLLSSSVYADEITENGSYRVVFDVIGATTYSETIYFTVTGINPQVKIEIPQNDGWLGNSTYFDISASAWGGVGIDYVNFYNSALGTITKYSTDPEPLTYPYTARFNVSSLAENTYYQFIARAYDFNEYSSSQVSRTMRIDRTAPVASIDSLSKTNNSITLNVSATDSGSGQNGFVFYLNDASVGTTIYGSTATYTFDNLNQGQQYKVGVRAFDNVLNWSGQVFQNVTTSDRPDEWSWTTAETNAFNNKGLITKLTWGRWNDFLDRVEEFVDYYNNKYGVSVPSVLSHKMTSGDRTLTATRFNGVRSSIGSMNSTGITDRVSGDLVLGSYFITLSQKLNGIT